jgi:hypothetical protein
MDILLSGDQSWAEEQQYSIASTSEDRSERSEEISQLKDLREVYQTAAPSVRAFFAQFLLLLFLRIRPASPPCWSLCVVVGFTGRARFEAVVVLRQFFVGVVLGAGSNMHSAVRAIYLLSKCLRIMCKI